MAWECKRCGKCCMYLFLNLYEVTDANREEVKDIGKWIAYHHCGAMTWKNKNGKEIAGIRVPLICAHLEWTPKDGFLCKIYEKRPSLCKAYSCEGTANERAMDVKIGKKEGGENNGGT